MIVLLIQTSISRNLFISRNQNMIANKNYCNWKLLSRYTDIINFQIFNDYIQMCFEFFADLCTYISNLLITFELRTRNNRAICVSNYLNNERWYMFSDNTYILFDLQNEILQLY